MRAIVVLLLVTASVVFSMVYSTSVEKTLPEDLYQWIGTKSANFQYLILSYEPDLVVLVKGWIFSPVSLGKQEERVFSIVAEGDDFRHEFSVKGKRSGIYIYMPQHLLVLPSNTRCLKLGGFTVEMPRRVNFSTRHVSRGGVEAGVYTVDESLRQTNVFETGQKILIRIDAGQKNTGGYSVRVDEVRLAGKRMFVKAHVESPEPGSMVTQAITYPSVLIELQERLEAGTYIVECLLVDRNVEKRFEAEFEVR
ncbi:protease complex subunit PrcB family protein [Thermotoga caldifontis]|uniref:protease complex subunit PrcB family protein n=1 Tax=Thermotoga caldifontis TaxID=1508419 RepID=UPI0011847FBA|nr:protease complex subunit PrcB family protein [Thermotoga caldifontis]